MYSGSSSIPPAIPQFNMESASDSTAGADLSGEYDVYLSFCGKDTRMGFVDLLYTCLQGAGVRTLRDVDVLCAGEEIGTCLLKAIKDSKILIPVFSKNYASSKWCMVELKLMVDSEAEAKGEKMIIPIFYDVDRSDVRYQSRSYEEEKTQGFDKKTIQGWKEGLTKVRGLPGFELNADGHEGELVKIIVEEVLLKLRKKFVHVPNNLVGMDNHIERCTDCSIQPKSLIVKEVYRKMYSGSSSIPPAIPQFNMESASDSTAGADLSGEYDVYLSFCGKDTRKGFVDFLYTCLQGAGVRTFRDDNELRVGEEIGSNVLKAIQDSKILIPVFSKNYASSKWCMFELKQMVDSEAEAEGEKMFIPIFYDVAPSDVRNQSRSYEEAFRQHEKTQGFDEKTIQGWKEGLTKVGSLSGLALNNGHEGELVKIIVEKVLLKLRKKYVHVPYNLVGMDNHIEQLMGLLELDSEDVRIVGIHGMGGLGKTTIAKVIYNQLCHRFEGHCFLQDVRERLKHKDGILNLQNQLITEIQNKDVAKFVDNYEGSYRIEEIVRGRKVLIILDDVDGNFHVNMLMENQSWFGAHSRIIITTRDASVLHAIDLACRSKDLLCVYESYKPNFIDDHDSLQLFSKYAFKRDSPLEGYEILSKEVVSMAAGLPLVLEILGSVFFGVKDKAFWEENLRKLRHTPHTEVQEILRYSFELLEYEQKQIYLDIACLFIGMDKTRPHYMWDGCGLHPKDGISVLVSRSLISVSDDNKLIMHDELRDLGRKIIRDEGLKELGRQSRLWCKEEAMHVLETHQGTKDVEALYLDFVSDDLEFRPNRLVGNDFVNLPNLRFLVLGSVDLDGNFEHLFMNIKWLKWAPRGSFSPINFYVENLVILDLSYSKITDDWKGWSQIKMAKHLKVLDLSHCYSLTTTNHFSMFVTLEQLILSNCFGLVEIDQSFGNLINLRLLDLSNCLVLRGMLNCEKFAKLKSLDVSCTKLRDLRGFGELLYLRSLNTSGCRFIDILSDLSNLTMLRKLDTSGCVNLSEIQGLEKLEYLQHFNMRGCLSMERIPNISELKMLEEVNIAKCNKLHEVDSLGNLEYLVTLDLSFCTSLKSVPNFLKFRHLKKLRICGLKTLKVILDLEVLESLELLDVTGCRSIRKLPLTRDLKQLKEIYACRCVKLAEIIGLEEVSSLELLDISGCVSIERLSNLSNLKRLRVVKASGCIKLSEILGLEELKCLELLNVRGCELLKYLPDLPNTRIDIN